MKIKGVTRMVQVQKRLKLIEIAWCAELTRKRELKLNEKSRGGGGLILIDTDWYIKVLEQKNEIE